MSASSAVVVNDLTVVRGGQTVLRGLDLTVERGTVTGLLGPSGSGKSTLMRALVGVQVVESGSITVLGRPAGTAELRDVVGYVTQSTSVYGDLTVSANLRYFAKVLGAPRSDVDRVIAQVDLVDMADHLVSRLSGGQKSRVSLAVALLGSPQLLVLDEPTVGLDPVLRRDLWALFHELARSGITLLVSSHVMDEASRCDRLILLREGEVLADATLTELLERTATKDVEVAFLSLIEGTQQ
ncbi:MAG: ABC transporter ATP-binding protein [Actinomycetes bacterium]